MKTVLFFLSVVLSFSSFAQLEEGFKKEEARDMAAICNSFTYLELYNSDSLIIPAGYERKYTSCTMGMDNIYQIYQKGNTAVINFRGSTDKKISWLENIYSAMIPAKGKIIVSEKKFKYRFAKDKGAAVHAGYALGIAFLHEDIIRQIKTLNHQGVYDFIITGHSQGGALANMLRAYLENLSRWKIRKKNEFKTYAFAAPMVGNKEFAEEYNAKYAVCQSSFNLVNTADQIPKLPLSYNETNYVSKNLKTFMVDNESFSLKKMISDGISLLAEISTKTLCPRVSKQIAKEVGPFVMPPYTENCDYYRLNNLIEIDPIPFPTVLKDSSILQNKFLKALHKKGDNGLFLKRGLYVKEPWTFQHKPYNYYVSILKMYFLNEYDLLERKYFIEE
jgi:hypothetical protein